VARAAAVGSELELTLGAFIGVHDSSDPGESRKTKLFESFNAYIPNLKEGSAVLARHGLGGLPTQLAGTGQLVFQHKRLDQTIDRFKVAGGRLYRWDGTNGVNAHIDITPIGVMIHPSNRVFAATLNDDVIFTDQNTNPWVYHPASGTFDIIQINSLGDEWASQGGPVIRSAKVMFVVKRIGSAEITTEADVVITTETDEPLLTELISGAQNTVIWSIEGNPLVGYQQDGFDNALTLTQTSDEIVAALDSEEAALVYWRNKGIGYIKGEVTDDFKASHTKDTASKTRGTDTPAALVSSDTYIWFVDMDGRVCRMAVGGEPEQLFFPMRREIQDHIGIAASRADVARYGYAAFHEGYNLVLFTIWDRQTIYVFDADTGIFVGNWFVAGDEGESIHIDAMGSMLDAENRATFIILGTRGSVYTPAALGVVWREKHKDADFQWLDQPNLSVASTVPLVRAAETQWVASDAAARFRATYVAAQLVGDVAQHEVGLQYTTPSGGRSTRRVALSRRTVGVKSDADAVSRAAWSPGKNAQGGVLRFRISATHSENVRWGLHSIHVKGVVTEARTNSR
jgi:hypothetical protein